MRFIKELKPEDITCNAKDFRRAYNLLKDANLESISTTIDAVKRNVRTIMLGIISLLDKNEEFPEMEELVEVLACENEEAAAKIHSILSADEEDELNGVEKISLNEILLRRDMGKKVALFIGIFQENGLETLGAIAAIRDKEFLQIKGLGGDTLDRFRRIFREYGINERDRMYLIGKRDSEEYATTLNVIIDQLK
jgi:hypothetical protein